MLQRLCALTVGRKLSQRLCERGVLSQLQRADSPADVTHEEPVEP